MKVRTQYHLAQPEKAPSETWENPRPRRSRHKNVAIIGCGGFSYSTIAYYANRFRPGSIRGVYDVDASRAISLCRRYGGSYAAATPEEIFADPEVDVVFIASNHASHAEYAIEALRHGKRVHIEKPHVVNHDQLERLRAAIQETGNREIYLGFNRPRSEHYAVTSEALRAQQGPSMLNWFIAGHDIDDEHWYFSPAEGGRVLGNLCHWTDLSLRMVANGQYGPISVVPGSTGQSKSDFATTLNFEDGSVATLTFSAKGHTFEGVREYLNAHRGDTLVNLQDFHHTTIDSGHRRIQFNTRYREHGHGANILNTLVGKEPESIESMMLTGRLMLGVKEALEEQKLVRVQPENTN